jgi:hypothetical protein
MRLANNGPICRPKSLTTIVEPFAHHEGIFGPMVAQ